MSDLAISSEIKNLADDYANKHISFFEYRLQRKNILLKLDKESNQVLYGNDITDIDPGCTLVDEITDENILP